MKAQLTSQEELLAQKMTEDILKSLNTSENPMGILIETYIKKQLTIYREQVIDQLVAVQYGE